MNKYVILQNILTADVVYLVSSADERLIKHVHILCYNTLSEHATKCNYARKQANLNFKQRTLQVLHSAVIKDSRILHFLVQIEKGNLI